ncbi:MAG: capsular biosynthesis protein [Bacillota bacterium]|nr:capsular biosynthesis protein [Bacillota bacterium]
MSIEVKFKEKLSKVLFLTLKKDRIKKIFHKDVSEELYIPIRSVFLANDEKLIESGEIPVSYFIEGMFYVLGADPGFKYNESYKALLDGNDDDVKYIKGRIFSLIDRKKYEEAYILLKGLFALENSQDILEKMILILNTLRTMDQDYEQELESVLDKAAKLDNFPMPYIYKALIEYEKKDYEGAFYSINTYFEKGGEKTKEALELLDSIKLGRDYKNGVELIDEEPKEALKLLLPLLKVLENDASLLYYIGIAYRNINIYEKAIYYQTEALRIDNNMIQSVNELGINYAALRNYPDAIKYLRRAFEMTKSIEICTNLIMCYIKNNEIENAKLHIAIAEKIDKNDEVLVQLKKLLNK